MNPDRKHLPDGADVAHLNSRQRAWLEIERRKLRPGMPDYQEFRRELMPIEVTLGMGFDDQDNPITHKWKPGHEANGFLMVTGGSGSGKTEALKLIGAGIAEHGIPLITIDFHGDVIFPGQTTVRLRAVPGGSDFGINPLMIEPAYIRQMGMGAKIQREVSRLSRAVGGMSEQQQSCLYHVMEQTYRQFGIREEDDNTWGRKPPTLLDIGRALSEGYRSGIEAFDKRTISSCWAKLRRICGNPVFTRGEPLHIHDLLGWNARLDCSRLDLPSQLLVAETVLEMLFEACRGEGEIPVQPETDADRYRAFVMIDEARVLTLGRGNPDASEHILNVMACQCRKFGIGLILASQMCPHFSREVHASFTTRLAMKRMDPNEAKKVAMHMGLAPRDLISSESPPGLGYFSGASTGGTVLLRMNQLPYRTRH
ncbi:MAG: hypothetical protein LPK06_07625 [Marinobacter sp.]|nr:hypothetical protein [Marinobacter sp.]